MTRPTPSLHLPFLKCFRTLHSVCACLSQCWREGVNHSGRNHPCRRPVSTRDRTPAALNSPSLAHATHPSSYPSALPLSFPSLLFVPSSSCRISPSFPADSALSRSPNATINSSPSKGVTEKKGSQREVDERGEAGGETSAGEGVSHTCACACAHSWFSPQNSFKYRRRAAPPALALGLAHSCEMHTDREREKKGV